MSKAFLENDNMFIYSIMQPNKFWPEFPYIIFLFIEHYLANQKPFQPQLLLRGNSEFKQRFAVFFFVSFLTRYLLFLIIDIRKKGLHEKENFFE